MKRKVDCKTFAKLLFCAVGWMCLSDVAALTDETSEHQAIRDYKKSVRKRISAYDDADSAANTSSETNPNPKNDRFSQSRPSLKKKSVFQESVRKISSEKNKFISSIQTKKSDSVPEKIRKSVSSAQKNADMKIPKFKNPINKNQTLWQKIQDYINSLLETIKNYLNAFLKKFGYSDIVEK